MRLINPHIFRQVKDWCEEPLKKGKGPFGSISSDASSQHSARIGVVAILAIVFIAVLLVSIALIFSPETMGWFSLTVVGCGFVGLICFAIQHLFKLAFKGST